MGGVEGMESQAEVQASALAVSKFRLKCATCLFNLLFHSDLGMPLILAEFRGS